MSQKPIKVIIAEDQPSNRKFLKNILEKHDDFIVSAEAEDGRDLINLCKKHMPQVIFVDIEMPKINGMEAVKTLLEHNEDLLVVFVTGHPDFAVEAFEVSSFDYILKPYTEDRIQKTLEKIRGFLKEREMNLQELFNIFKKTDKLYVKCGYELHFIDADSIYFMEKERKKTVIHTVNGKYETHEPINELEKRLNPTNFFRSHKCYLINLKMVEKILPWGDNSYLVKFINTHNDALMSRSKVKMLYEMLDVGSE
ncbi:LytR/AlgR family response regulator transcription factor [Phosphitispora sp. TUW77]|uniref:LytR/AlgR family response regulator transcription factor n=1 Tax=Phosphitispora sp. TUW77 TaxID=3152361 RepID=UPI003AB6E6E8